MTVIDVGEHIVIDPEIVHGRMTFRATRIPYAAELDAADDRILAVLQTLRTPTLVPVDDWFWDRDHRDRRYCTVFVALRGRSDSRVPDLLRRLVRLSEFRTRAARMDKVVHPGEDHVRWWQIGDDSGHAVHWGRLSRRVER